MVEATAPRRGGALHGALTETLAGAAGAAAALPLVLTLGVLALAATGAHAAALGVAAALAGNVGGGLVMAGLSRSPMPTAGPSSATAVIFAALVARLAADPALDLARPADVALLVALAGLAVSGAGLLMLGMALLRLGSLARLVPQPVLAGFMNGVALLILAAQIPPLLGLADGAWQRRGLAALADMQVAPLLIGLGTALLAWALMRRAPRLPAALLALLAGVLAAELVPRLWPGLPALPRLEAVAAVLPSPLSPSSLFGATALDLLQRNGGAVALAALLLAVLGGLESVLGIAATESAFGFRTDPNRELLALGGANVVSGLLGGMPVVFLRMRAIASWQAGGRTRWAAAAGAILLGLAFVLGQSLLARLPLAVLAGLMVVIALGLADGWTRQLAQRWWAGERSAELRQSLAIVAVVCAVTLWLGFAAGVAVGLLLSMALFVRAMNRSLLRARFDASAQPSRRVYPGALEALLAPARARIEIIELEGALYFGNAERLADVAETGAVGREVLILDLRRVSTVDASGAVVLERLARTLAQRGCRLALAGAAPLQRHGQTLRAYGVLGPGRPCQAFADTDQAIEDAEQALLAAAGVPLQEDIESSMNFSADQALLAAAGVPLQGLAVPLADCALLQGLTPPQLQRLLPLLRERRLAAGERLFAEGDAGSAVFVLTEGSITIVGSADADRSARQRFISFSPGMTLGETAVLDGGGRTADAWADGPCTLYELAAQTLRALQHEHPDIAALIFRNLALHLSARLRSAAAAWRRAAG